MWLSEGTRKDLICRTVGSGGQFTSYANRNTSAGIPGDLRAQDPLAFKFFDLFVVECKHWKNLNLHQFLNGTGDLHKAMLKVEKESVQSTKAYWALIAKQNNQPDLLLLPGLWADQRRFTIINHHKLFSGCVYLFNFDYFLKEISPKVFFNEEEN